MPSHFETLDIDTKKNFDIVNITRMVNDVIKGSGIKSGSILVHTPHTTCALTVNEDEGRLLSDLQNKYLDLVPKGEGYSHDGIDNNAHSHILASIIGCSISLPLVNGRPALGTWQSILLIDLDGPRSRRVMVQIGE